MNSKKAIRILIFFIVSIISMFFLWFIYQEDNDENLIINEIINCEETNTQIDLEKLGIYSSDSLENSDEYLAMSYYKLKNEENNDEAIQLLKESVKAFNSKTEFSVKYLTIRLLISELITNGEGDEALKYFHEIKNFSNEELSDNENYIKGLFNLIVNVDNGRSSAIDLLEYLLKDSKKMSGYARSSYSNALGMLYAMEGQYSKGMETLLKSIGDLEEIDGEFFELKSMVEIGNIFSDLDQVEAAKSIYKKVIELNSNNEEIVNYIMVYSYINLFEMLIYQEEYEEFFEIAYEIDKYSQGIDEKSFESSLRLRDLSLAHAFIMTGEIEYGYEILQKINFKQESSYIDDDSYAYMILGDYYYESGDFQNAFIIYEETYNERGNNLSIRYKKMLLERLIKASHTLENKDNELIYREVISDIYKNSIEIISEDYITYIVKQYKSNQRINEVIIEKVEIIIFTLVVIMITILILSKLKKAIRKSNIDEASMVYNRKYFKHIYDMKFKKNKEFTMIIYDIDDFKLVNDNYGHAFGDKVIKEIAKIAANCVRNKGEVFRYGGEEFIVIVNSNDIEEAIHIAENIRSKVEKIKWEEDIVITISLGISKKKKTKEATFEKADNNLYISKRSGKNKITY